MILAYKEESVAPSLPYAVLRRLRAFPPMERTELLEKIACHQPAREAFVADFHSNAERLHREGFSLIDVEHRPDALTSVWYRRKPSLLKKRPSDVALLQWEQRDQGETTRLVTWRI
jgi:hypothetical protein